MEALWEFYLAHAFWTWIAVGAALLAAEVATGSGYLLWPAACAVPVGLFAISPLNPGLPAELGVFAILTIIATLASRKLLAKAVEKPGPDVNDPLRRLVGAHGHVVGTLEPHRGRVFVQGKEWAATLEGEGKLGDGAEVEVIGAADATTLRVRAS